MRVISATFAGILATAFLAEGQTGFRFVSWADTKSGTTVLSTLSDQVVGDTTLNFLGLSTQPVFTIYPGDLESSGFTTSGIAVWKNATNGMLTGNPTSNGLFNKTFAVRGNHDASNSAGWQGYFNFGTNTGTVGATWVAGDNLTYAFTYGNAIFIGLDVPGDAASELSSTDITFLENQLYWATNKGLTHAFIFFHGPSYCVAEHCSCPANDLTCNTQGAPLGFFDVINRYPIVTATFHGHEHVYAHTRLDSTRVTTLTHPFDQFVTGNAGADGNYSCTPGRTDYCQTEYGFATIDVNGTDVTVNIYKQGSYTPADTVAIHKGGGGDTIPPTASLTAPTNGQTVAGSVAVTAVATDNVGVTKVDLLVDGAQIYSCTASPCSTTWDTSKVANGSHTLTARAHDAAGNIGTSQPVTVIVSNLDTIAPQVSISSPLGGTVSGRVKVAANATDNVGVTKVQFYYDDTMLIGTDSSSPYRGTWNTTAVADGTHTLTAKAYDAAGNFGTSSQVTVTVKNTHHKAGGAHAM